jgi:hypothetical protein
MLFWTISTRKNSNAYKHISIILIGSLVLGHNLSPLIVLTILAAGFIVWRLSRPTRIVLSSRDVHWDAKLIVILGISTFAYWIFYATDFLDQSLL